MSDVKLYNRHTKSYVEESVPSGFFIHFLYNSIYAKSLLLPLIIRKFVSSIAGKYCDKKLSAKGINKFIKNNKIDMDRYAKKTETFSTFNEFFARELKPELFDFDRNVDFLYAPCDGKIRAYENIEIDSIVQFKNLTYSLAELVGSEDLAKKYEGGSICVIRLSPTDYHRFHHFDEGQASAPNLINGKYYSVNNTALEKISDLYIKNKRYVTEFDSVNFGKVLIVDVAATCVGSVCYNDLQPDFMKERGFFKFGGSTIIMIFEKDRVKFDQDIIEQTIKNNECIISIGEKIGEK